MGHKNQRKKRLLIYAHYYIPDTASTGQILRELAEGMLDTFDITVICVVPSYLGKVDKRYRTRKYYEEWINGVKVLRIRVPEFSKSDKVSRIRNILTYFFGAITATFKVGRMDYVLAISQPPILGGLLGVWGKWVKRAKFIYNIQDFNPEQVMAVGYSKNKFIVTIMKLLDKFNCKQSNLVITVGRDLVETMNARFKGKKVPRTVMINNWIDENQIYPLPETHDKVLEFKNKYELNGKFVFMYSGNLGLYYDLDNLIKVIEKFKPGTKTSDGRDVVFAFVGAGSVLDKLSLYKEQNGMDNVVFIPYQEKEHLIYSLNSGDVHWCINAKGIKGVSCPSKYYGIAAVAKPVLGVLEEGSEVRLLIEDANSGKCSEPGEYNQVEESIKWFIEKADSEILKEMGMRNHNRLINNMTKNVSVEKYDKAILGI